MTEENVNQEVEETDEELEEGNETQESSEEQPQSVEELQKQLADTKKALDKANRERARLGRKVKETRETPETPVLTDAAKRVLVINSLQAEGLNRAQAAKLAKLYDLSDVDIEEDEVIGIDFQDLKEEFPQLFEKESTPGRKNVRRVDTGNKQTVTPAGTLSQASRELLGL